MKALVIGANGFLGSNLVNKCLSLSWEVTCVYHRLENNIPKSCERYSYDQIKKIKPMFDLVFLLAAVIPYKNFDTVNFGLFDSNIDLTISILQKFTNSKIVFSSTAAVYGYHTEVITESSAFNNPNFYAMTKLAAETILRFHPCYQIVRFSSLYGKGMNPSTILPSIINDAKKKKRITLYGSGSRVQDYLYVDDAVGYLLASAACSKSWAYLGVNGCSHSNAEVAEIVKSFVKGCTVRYRDEDTSPSFRYNNDLTMNTLQYKPQISFAEGVERLFNYG